MLENPQTPGNLRPVDLAREHGLSVQAIRNYEAAGILPEAIRTAAGYRIFAPLHLAALRAFLALVPAHGHHTATAIMASFNRFTTRGAERGFQLIGESHLQILDDRRTLLAVEKALEALNPQPEGGPEMFVGALAHRLGLRPATLRKWEAAGLVRPDRDPQTGYRIYRAADVRDAAMVHQLRRGGYRLSHIAPVIEQVRTAGGVAPLAAMLEHWHARLNARSRAMLAGAAALEGYLALDDYRARVPVSNA